MRKALNPKDSKAVSCKGADGARRCLACGENKPKASLIRFVAGPDGRLAFDLSSRLPGRGLWLCARRDCLLKALKSKLFNRAMKGKQINMPAEFFSGVTDLLGRRCRDLLGLAAKAGCVVFGLPQIEQALHQGKLSFVVFANDIGADGRKKLAAARSFQSQFSQIALGAALGKDRTAYAGCMPHALTDKLAASLDRWLCVAPPQFLNDEGDRVDGP